MLRIDLGIHFAINVIQNVTFFLSHHTRSLTHLRFAFDRKYKTCGWKVAQMAKQTLDPRIVSMPAPQGIDKHPDFTIKARPAKCESQSWTEATPYRVMGSRMDLARAALQEHPVCLSSIELDGPFEFMVQWSGGTIHKAEILPSIHNIDVEILEHNSVRFTMETPRDVMLMLNGNKWTALHLIVNSIDHNAPTCDTADTWYFGPGINNGKAYQNVVDGKLRVPSGMTVYLSRGAFLTAGLHFKDVHSAGVRGPGFIYHPEKSSKFLMEQQGALLIEGSRNISVKDVTAVTFKGFAFLAGQSKGVTISQYRSFSSEGNSDGLHFLSTSDVKIEKCFIRSSDDSIAINCDRWEYHGSAENYTIDDCVLLADVAHPILIGTHGDPKRPAEIRNIKIRNIDILDHEEPQVWYQGCMALNAGDGNLLEDLNFIDVRVRKITKGQLFNIRVMQNAMWTTGPGRSVRNVTFENLELDLTDSENVYPSQILGYDHKRCVEGITFKNLSIGGETVHRDMDKPRWYMLEDFVPVFVNEHVAGLAFVKS